MLWLCGLRQEDLHLYCHCIFPSMVSHVLKLQRALKAHIVTGKEGGQFIDEIKLHAAMRLSLPSSLGL